MNHRDWIRAWVFIVALNSVWGPVSLAAPGFAKSYRAPDGFGAWTSGLVTPLANATGYTLTDSSLSNRLSLTRFKSNGDVDWAVWAPVEPLGEITLRAHPTQPLVYAAIEGLPTEAFWTVFGVFNALDGRPQFELGIAVTVDQPVGSQAGYWPDPQPTLGFLSDGRCTVILEGHGSEQPIHMAILDQTGHPQWERSFLVDPVATGASASSSSLIEDPGHGFWLLTTRSQPLSVQPNPPPINSAVTFNVVRLDDAGTVLWAKKLTGLQTAGLPTLGTIAIGADHSLVLTFMAEILSSPVPNPAPSDFTSYIVVLNGDGTLRWTRKIPTVAGTGLTPFWSPDQAAIYFSGGQFNSVSPLKVDGLVMKLDAHTGQSLAQASIHLNALQELSVAGIVNDRIYFSSLPGSLQSPSASALIGYCDLTLQQAAWQQFNRYQVSQAQLSLDPNGGFLFSAFAPSGPEVDAISLDMDLAPVVTGSASGKAPGPCQFFTSRTITVLNPDLTVEGVELKESSLSLSVYAAALPLFDTTRIQLHAFTPVAADLCPNATPHLSWESDSAHASVNLVFQSQAGTQYELLFTPRLDQPFHSLETFSGDGKMATRAVSSPKTGNGFYAVRLVSP